MRCRQLTIPFYFVFSSTIVLWTTSYGQPAGSLDIDFGMNGIYTNDIQNLGLRDQISQLSVQPDGKIIFVGGIRDAIGTEADLLIGRLNESGSSDPTFGDQGTTVTDIGGVDGLVGLHVQPSGNILCAGTSNQSGPYEHAFAQYDPNGNLDPSFGTAGVVYNAPLATSSTLTAGLFESETIYATGTMNGDVLASEYNSDGSSVNSFGTSGSVSHDLGLIETITELALQDDGKIVLAGYQSESGNPEDALVCRLNADGSLDPSFNSIGWINLGLSPNLDRATDIVVDEDGRILVIGITVESATSSFEIFAVRLMPDGSYDSSFGTNGIARYDIGAGDDYANDVILQPDGKLIIGGGTNDDGTNLYENFCLIRLNDDGSLDQSFGNSGIVVTEISSSYERIIDMVLQDDGKLIVAGIAKIGSSEDIALARYHTGLNLSVNDRDEKPLFSVYPSPATGYLSISSKVKLQTIELTDALGKKVLTVKPNSNQMQLDIALLPSGIYLLRATDGQRLYTQKLVKE